MAVVALVFYFALVFIRCVSYGVLPDDEAIKLYDKVMKRKKMKTGGSPSKSEVAVAKNTKKRKTNNIHDDVAVDVGMQVGGEEGIGTSSLVC